jgi:hypothetical protein
MMPSPVFLHGHVYLAQCYFCVAFVSFIVLERLIHAICVAILLVLGKGNVYQSIACTQLAVGVFSTLSVVGRSLFSGLQGVANRLFWLFSAGLVLTIVSVLVFTLFEFCPDCVVSLVHAWERDIGPAIKMLTIVPLSLVVSVLNALIPVYNSIVWLTGFLFRLLVVNSSIQKFQAVAELGRGVTFFVTAVVNSVADYCYTLKGCDIHVSNDVCLNTGARTLDLITPMEGLQKISIPLVELCKFVCLGASGVVDVVAYPLFDINLAKSIHNLVNSFLFAAVQMPIVTYQRCQRYANGKGQPDSPNVVYCLPDLAPAFNFFCAGVRNLGVLVDNWLNVVTVIVQQSIFGNGPVCRQLGTTLTVMNQSSALFGRRETSLVSLDEGMYAVTDGYNVQYFNHYTQAESVLHQNAWPIVVEPGWC